MARGSFLLSFALSGCNCGGGAPLCDVDEYDGGRDVEDHLTRCPGEAYYFDWSIDGEHGTTECGEAYGYGSTSTEFGDSKPQSTVLLGGIALEAPHPLCGGSEFWFANIELVTGARGSVASVRSYSDQEPSVWVRTQAAIEGVCGGEEALTMSGSWHVLDGGTWGDVVTVEFRDLVFQTYHGADIQISYYYWRGRLPDPPIRYP